MTGQGVTLECAACGNQWTVLPKGDGTMPAGSRCPRASGGCGKLRKLPRPAARAAVAVAEPPGAWDPPSQPRAEHLTDGECPECGAALIASPRSTFRLCPQCKALRTPPGVLAPYARGSEVTRAARSQRERDEDAKRTVLLAGEFIRRVAVLLADPKLHPQSADLLRWYEEEITDARRRRDARRLAELHDEFTADTADGAFRRLHWWQGEPAVIAAAVEPGNDGEDYDGEPADYADDDERQGDDPAAGMLAAPAAIVAQPQAMTWGDALAAFGWRIAAASISGGVQTCQIVDEHGQRCGRPALHGIRCDALGRHVWLCPAHHDPLGGLIIETSARGAA